MECFLKLTNSNNLYYENKNFNPCLDTSIAFSMP